MLLRLWEQQQNRPDGRRWSRPERRSCVREKRMHCSGRREESRRPVGKPAWTTRLISRRLKRGRNSSEPSGAGARRESLRFIGGPLDRGVESR